MGEALVWGLFGTIVGSFLNVLILRHGERGIGGRSACMTCGAQLRFFDLIPVLSWIFLKGRCRYCRHTISIQYPLVELSTAVAFALIGGAPIELSFKILGLPIVALLIAIAVHDLRTTIIPDPWVLTLGILTFFAAVGGAYSTHSGYLIPLLAGPLAALPLFLLWYVSKGTWMGLGDPKLALSIGWLLGFPGGVNAVLLAFILGALVAVPILFLSSSWWVHVQKFIPITRFHKKQLGFTMKSEIPFGPFLVAACCIVWFSHMYSIALPFVW